jgi:hypothetical protein
MSLKTTVILLVLVVGAGAGWFVFSLLQSGAAANQPPEILRDDVRNSLRQDRSDQAVRLVLEHGDQRVELERPAGKAEWVMPGNWPTRSEEVKKLTRLLAGLQSRFVPLPLPRKKKVEYGLDKPGVTVTLEVGKTRQTL